MTIELAMAFVPSRADLLLANAIPAEGPNDGGPIEAGVPGISCEAVNVSWQSILDAEVVQLSKIIIERTVLLQHENNMVDDAGISVAAVVLGTAAASATTWKKGHHADAQQ